MSKIIDAGADVSSLPHARFISRYSRFRAEFVILLVRAGLDANTVEPSSGNTLLHFASFAVGDSARLVSVLVAAGAKIDAVNAEGDTPLALALSRSIVDVSLIRCLLSHGACAGDRRACNGQTACHVAAANNNCDLVAALIDDYGADINAVSNDKKTPLMIAMHHGAWDVVSLLLGRGAIVDESALNLAICELRTEIAEALIEGGANVGACDASGFTPLHCAVAIGSNRLVDRLLAAGVNVNAATTTGETAIHIAVVGNDAGLTQKLVSAGADACATNSQGRNACHIAAVNKPAMLRLLIDVGANFNQRDGRRATPLATAVGAGSRECVRLLLDAGAKITRVDRSGDTLLHLLLRNGHFDAALIRTLVAHGVDVNAREPSRLAADAESRDCLVALFAIDAKLLKPANSVGTLTKAILAAAGAKSRSRKARKEIAEARLALVRARGTEVCIALQAMQLDTLQLTEIIVHASAPAGKHVPFHELWRIATKVKHFK